jgi:aminoglycoside phosphotransferase (APT) family kinase protein
LHEIEPGEVGLSDLARPGSYLERQIRRWGKQIDQPVTVSGTLLVEAKDILVDSIPPERCQGIVHGDFRLGNMIVDPDGTVRALLDWELAAIGDTLVDVGWMISSWSEAGEPSTSPFVPPTTAGGFPTRDEMISLYANVTGRDLSDLPYYVAFSHWRAACIGEGLTARYRSNVMGRVDFDVDQYERSILETAELALQLLRQL